ncbi:MAG: SDR family oxidoreductase [Hyphomicrobiales bacterium]|nr:SDR family oxidoreductase [Hyphomicrobiales bacterium]
MAGPFLIFGAVGGIGEALARNLTAAGHPVFLTSRNESALLKLGEKLSSPALAADVLDEAALEAVVGEAAKAGELSGLAYCVGSIVLKPLRQVTATQMAEAFALNVTGGAMAVKFAAPALKVGKGSVVLFSSIAARRGFANHAIIGAAKAGIEGLTVSLAAELAPEIRVNCIAPSLTDTPLAKSMTSNPAMADAIAKMHPIPRLGAADDHAAVAAFLMSDAAGWITGQIFRVDGGRSSISGKG